MKKLFAMSAALAMLYTSFSIVSANAADSLKLEVAKISAEAGETIAIPVSITENTGIIAIGFTVDYNAEALELISVEDEKLFSGASFTVGGDVTVVPYRVMWDDGLASDDYTDVGTIATLNFRVLDTAESGIYEISVNVESDNTFNVNFDDVSFETVNGSVTIHGEETTPSETTITSETTTTAEETTTSETTTTAEETTTIDTTSEATVDPKQIAPDETLLQWAAKDYMDKTGTEVTAVPIEKVDGIFAIALKDSEGNNVMSYEIDTATGIGTDSNGEEVNLPQTGNNSLGTVTTAAGAAALTVLGAFAVMKSGVFRKKKEDE